jgi:hypothetical protein
MEDVITKISKQLNAVKVSIKKAENVHNVKMDSILIMDHACRPKLLVVSISQQINV